MPHDTGPSPSRRSLSVLVVEDDFVISATLAAVLELNGHTVVGPSGSVPSALKLLETARPDAALLDVKLQGRLAMPVAERLRRLGIPFVVTSAYATLDFEGCEFVKGAPHLLKPFDEQRLLDALNLVAASRGAIRRQPGRMPDPA